MYVPLSCILVDADAANLHELGSFLAAHGAEVVARLESIDELGAVLARGAAPQLAIVNLDPKPQEAVKLVGHIARQNPSVSFIVLSSMVDASLVLEAMHQGVREFIPLPVQEDKLAAGLERVAQLHGAARKARCICVAGAAGGCGSSTISCNIATALARNGKSVLLDLDFMRGSVSAAFDLRPRYSIADVLSGADHVDRQLLDNVLAVHKDSGVAVLARPDRLEDVPRLETARLSPLLEALGKLYDYVVVDSLLRVDGAYEAAIRAADLIVLVLQLNVTSARNAERFITALARMGIESDKLRLVVNRYHRKSRDIEPAEVERVLRSKIHYMLPNDYRSTIDAINFGQPVVLRWPRSDISAGLGQLASLLNGVKHS